LKHDKSEFPLVVARQRLIAGMDITRGAVRRLGAAGGNQRKGSDRLNRMQRTTAYVPLLEGHPGCENLGIKSISIKRL